MSYSYLQRRQASKEFTDAFVWYESEQEGLGESFIEAVRHKLDKICDNPYHYKNSYGIFHEALTEKFPFLIVYFIDEENNIVVVTAIFHTSRNPRGKFSKTRLK